MSFKATKPTKGEGENVGSKNRGKVWAPVYSMSRRPMDKISMGGAKSNDLGASIEGRVAGKSNLPRQSK